MSEREWKPGDVAAVVSQVEGNREVVAIRGRGEWNAVDSTGLRCHIFGQEKTARPLVVIDPEDKSFAEKIREYLDAEADWHGMHEDDTVETLQDALRSLVAPPKPPEPTGLGAVVEDAEGCKWVRVFEAGAEAGRDVRWASGASREPWSTVAAVRVLSEGVQP